MTQRIAGNGGNVEPRKLQELQERLDEEVAGIARCVARIHEVGALVKDLDQGSSTSPRCGRAKTCSSAGDSARTRSATGTGSRRASRGASRSRSKSAHIPTRGESSTRHPVRAYR